MIAIRTDSNEKIATGHLMRCIAIASQIRKLGVECIFVTSDKKSLEIINVNNFKAICLDSKWDELENETQALVEILNRSNVKLLLIDSYFVTKKYLSTINKYVKTTYIDDLDMFQYPVDILINYNIYYNLLDYDFKYKNINIRQLLGCTYVPLREEFQKLPCSVLNEKVTNVLITTGGADEMNIAGSLLEKICYLKIFQNIIFHLVVGRYNKNIQQLKALASQNKNVHLYFNVTKMSQLMLKCDIAISASGSTLYELSACGVPTICFCLADNQLNVAKGFSDSNLMLYAGDFRNDKEKCLNTIIDSIKKLMLDYALRLDMSLKIKKVVDGNGAKRIAEILIQECNNTSAKGEWST